MKKDNFNEQKMIIGFKTIILGICLYILELLSLPVFGILQKMQVGGNGFYSTFWQYTDVQPYPVIFKLTGVVIILGLALLIIGYKGEKKSQ